MPGHLSTHDFVDEEIFADLVHPFRFETNVEHFHFSIVCYLNVLMLHKHFEASLRWTLVPHCSYSSLNALPLRT